MTFLAPLTAGFNGIAAKAFLFSQIHEFPEVLRRNVPQNGLPAFAAVRCTNQSLYFLQAGSPNKKGGVPTAKSVPLSDLRVGDSFVMHSFQLCKVLMLSLVSDPVSRVSTPLPSPPLADTPVPSAHSTAADVAFWRQKMLPAVAVTA